MFRIEWNGGQDFVCGTCGGREERSASSKNQKAENESFI